MSVFLLISTHTPFHLSRGLSTLRGLLGRLAIILSEALELPFQACVLRGPVLRLSLALAQLRLAIFGYLLPLASTRLIMRRLALQSCDVALGLFLFRFPLV